MIVAQIEAKRHLGCWASDTSLQFPTFNFKLFLVNYERDFYEVIARFDPKDSSDTVMIPKILDRIRQHPLWWGTTESEGFRPTDRLIRIRDKGKCEGLIRPILYEKGSEFPLYQLMEVEKGKETVYGVFKDIKYLKNVEKSVKMKIGTRNTQTTILKENVSPNEVINLIPTWYDCFIEPTYAGMIKNAIKLAEEGKKLTRRDLERIKDFLMNHPELIAIVYYILKAVFGRNLEIPFPM